MSKQPYLRSLSIKHYRGLASLSLEPLRRITLLGGLNGAGKTTLLDAVFQFLDTGNPGLLLRPAQFRQTPTTLADVHRINEGADPDQPGLHQFVTRDGVYALSWNWGPVAMGPTPPKVISTQAVEGSQSTQNQHGYKLQVSRNHAQVLTRFYAPGETNDSMIVQQEIGETISIPMSSYLTRATINSPADIANKYSQVVQAGMKARFLEIVNSVSTKFDDLEILHIANQPVLHLSLGSVLVPLPFAGDGITAVAAIALAIMTSRGGVVLVDEFDASVHYTRLRSTWALFHQLCVEFDAQIIAATHSRECVEELFDAIDASHSNDVIYHRLDRVRGKNVATTYTWEEVRQAAAEGWEFR